MKVMSRKEPVKWGLEKVCTSHGNTPREIEPCGSLLRVEKDDLRFYDGSSGYFERDDAVTFRCPVCGNITDLDPSEWPTDARSLTKFNTMWRDTGIDNPTW